MLLWFVGLSVAGVFLVFRDAAMDYRLVAAGALLPDVFDLAVHQGRGVLHSVTGAVALLVLVMAATTGRRVLRRRLLAVPIGVFAHLVLDGAWADTHTFWWPLAGWSLRGGIPSFGRDLAVLVVQELVGVAAIAWCHRRFGLRHPVLRRRFVRTGRVERRLV